MPRQAELECVQRDDGQGRSGGQHRRQNGGAGVVRAGVVDNGAGHEDHYRGRGDDSEWDEDGAEDETCGPSDFGEADRAAQVGADPEVVGVSSGRGVVEQFHRAGGDQ